MLLTTEDRRLLGSLLRAHVAQVVRDLDAIYFVQRARTVKVQALADDYDILPLDVPVPGDGGPT